MNANQCINQVQTKRSRTLWAKCNQYRYIWAGPQQDSSRVAHTPKPIPKQSPQQLSSATSSLDLLHSATEIQHY